MSGYRAYSEENISKWRCDPILLFENASKVNSAWTLQSIEIEGAVVTLKYMCQTYPNFYEYLGPYI